MERIYDDDFEDEYEDEEIDVFAKVINYKIKEGDITLLEAINRALQYERIKENKNKDFLNKVLAKSDIEVILKDRLSYIFNLVSIYCEESDEDYTLRISSNISGLDVDFELTIKKNSVAPSIKVNDKPTELESIIANVITRNTSFEELIDLCKINTMYNCNKTYVASIGELPIELNLSDNKITIKEKGTNETRYSNILEIWSPNVYTNERIDSSISEELHTIRNNLMFFIKNSYVNKSELPEQLFSYDYTNENELEQLIKSSSITNPNEESEDYYYIEVGNSVKELTDISTLEEIEKNVYKCVFTDGSSLEFSKNRLFTVTKSKRPSSKAEKILGVR